MLGVAGANYHFEFTHCRKHPVRPIPTVEDLVVFYIPSEPEWQRTCASMLAAGFKHATAFNPYWEAKGRTYEDCDGDRIIAYYGWLWARPWRLFRPGVTLGEGFHLGGVEVRNRPEHHARLGPMQHVVPVLRQALHRQAAARRLIRPDKQI